MDAIKRPSSLLKVVQIVFGILACSLCFASRPRDIVKGVIDNGEDQKIQDQEQDFLDIWKIDFFLAMTVISLLVTIAMFVVTFSSDSKNKVLQFADLGTNFVLGFLLMLSASLLLGEFIHWYSYRNDICIKSWVDPLQSKTVIGDILDLVKKCGLTGGAEKLCSCWIKEAMKYDITVASTAIGIVNAVFYFMAGALSFM